MMVMFEHILIWFCTEYKFSSSKPIIFGCTFSCSWIIMGTCTGDNLLFYKYLIQIDHLVKYFKPTHIHRKFDIALYSSSILQVKFTILVKQTDWCYILGSPKPTRGGHYQPQNFSSAYIFGCHCDGSDTSATYCPRSSLSQFLWPEEVLRYPALLECYD
jgi:uncharacterized membrane protein YciS (DUF1049 family)